MQQQGSEQMKNAGKDNNNGIACVNFIIIRGEFTIISLIELPFEENSNDLCVFIKG